MRILTRQTSWGGSNFLNQSMEQTAYEENLSTKQYQTKTDTRILDPDGNPRRP
jgi:hypothetical protein